MVKAILNLGNIYEASRLTFPVLGYKIREIRLLHFSSIVFIFETIFIQLSYTRHIYIYIYIYMYVYIYIIFI